MFRRARQTQGLAMSSTGAMHAETRLYVIQLYT